MSVVCDLIYWSPFCWESFMKTRWSLTFLATILCSSFLSASGADVSSGFLKGVRVGGFLGDKVMLVLPDRTASLVSVGESVSGVKLANVGTTTVTLEAGQQKEILDLGTAWQLAPHADLTSWRSSYLKLVGKRVDAQNPEVSKAVIFRAFKNGAAQTDDVEITQGVPYPKLPRFLESASLTASYAPDKQTSVSMNDMIVTEQAYQRLLKSPFAAATTQPKQVNQ